MFRQPIFCCFSLWYSSGSSYPRHSLNGGRPNAGDVTDSCRLTIVLRKTKRFRNVSRGGSSRTLHTCHLCSGSNATELANVHFVYHGVNKTLKALHSNCGQMQMCRGCRMSRHGPFQPLFCNALATYNLRCPAAKTTEMTIAL